MPLEMAAPHYRRRHWKSSKGAACARIQGALHTCPGARCQAKPHGSRETFGKQRFSTVDMPASQTYNDGAEIHAESDRTLDSLAYLEDVSTYVSTH